MLAVEVPVDEPVLDAVEVMVDETVDVAVVLCDVEMHVLHCAGQSRSTVMLVLTFFPLTDSITWPHLSLNSVKHSWLSCRPLQKSAVPVVVAEVLAELV